MKNRACRMGMTLLMGICILSVMAQSPYKYLFRNPDLTDEERLSNLLSLMTFDEKINAFGGAGVPRLGVSTAGSIEAIHGVVLGGPAWDEKTRGPKQPTTIFPQGYGLGETWDAELIKKVADHIAYEARYLYQSPKYRKGGLVLWSPNADLGRDIRWGRTEECYGEDPYLVGELVVSFVKGLQGDHPVYWKTASLMKHFLANSNEYGRTETSSNFDETLFREYYAYPFWKGIAKGGSNALMTAYNAYNNIPCTIHPVLKDVLKKEWGFTGMIITDAGAFRQLVSTHKQFNNLEDAARACIKAGIVRFLDDYRVPLLNACRQGLVTEAELDENIKGSYRVFLKLGLLDESDNNPYKDIGVKDTLDPWLKQETKDFVRLVANKSVVLLKNEKEILPLNKSVVKKIAVIGNRADAVIEDWYSGTLPYKITPLEGIRNAVAGQPTEVRYAKDDRKGEAQQLAHWADVVIVCTGNEPTGSPEWGAAPWGKSAISADGREDVDRGSLQLEQEDLIRLVHKANPHTVVVLISSFPYAINWTQAHVPAIIHLTQSCQEMGNAVADVLFGTYNPAGRTTQTWLTGIDELPHMLDYNIRNGRTYMYYKGKPLYPFGFGLSYTTFRYTNLKISQDALRQGSVLEVSVDIQNTGRCDGEEVVQLYVNLPDDDTLMRLKGFRRVALKQGEMQTVKLTLSASDVSRWDVAGHAFKLPKGKMSINIGTSSADIRLKGSVRLQ